MERNEQEIWRRVNAGREPVNDDLTEALNHAVWLASAYRALGKTSMADTERANAACLRGMLMLDGQSAGMPRPFDLSGENRARLMAQAFRRSRQEQRIFACRLADPDYGPVFQAMAHREQAQMAQTLEMMGG